MPFRITPAGLALGGTISGNLVITGTLNVQGAVTFDVAQTTTGLFNAEGGIIIDETGLEVFLVRQEADAGDNFWIDNTSDPVHVYIQDQTSVAADVDIRFRRSRAGLTTIVSGDSLGGIDFWGHDGTDFIEMAGIACITEGTIATNRIPTTLVFKTGTDAAPSVFTTRLTIDSAGRSLFEGIVLIDETATEALLVRKDTDGGDVFTVDTSGDIVAVTGALTVSTTLAVTGATTFQGATIIDSDGTETFLIRKNADGGDIFAVDPDNAVVAITGSLTISTDLAVPQGGTGASTFTDGGIMLGSGAGALSVLARGTAGQMLIGSTSGDPVMGTITGTANEITVTTGDGTLGLAIPDAVTLVTLTLTNDLTVANGGTGAGTFTDGGLMLGSGTGALSVLARGTAGQMLIGSTSGDPVMGTLAGTANEVAVTTGDGTLQVGLATNITVAGTLGVTGATTLQAATIIDLTATEALLVRKDADGGDIFVVNTTAASAKVTGDFEITNDLNLSAGVVYQQEHDMGTVGATETLDWSNSNKQKATLDENLTFTFTDPPGPANLVLKLVQDAGATNTVTWPASVLWEGGTAPVITATNAAIDVLSFYFDGTNYFGSFLQDFS